MRLHTPPFLQIALDQIDKQEIIKVISSIPKSKQILLEAGTPLIKKFGSKMIEQIRSAHPSSYIVADMKTLDLGSLEVQIAVEASANAVAISGLAPIETIESALTAGLEMNCDIIIDCMNVNDPISLISKLSKFPKVILLHRGIDQEGRTNQNHPWHIIKEIKNKYPESLIAVAGGLNLDTSSKALHNGADIIVVGRAITQARSVEESVNEFLHLLK